MYKFQYIIYIRIHRQGRWHIDSQQQIQKNEAELNQLYLNLLANNVIEVVRIT